MSFILHSVRSIERKKLAQFSAILDADYVQVVHEKLHRLYTRITMSQENIDIVLESIQVWELTPTTHRSREDNRMSVLDTDCETRDLKCKDTEVNNSKKLIAFIAEENYRLLFGLPALERKKEFGIDRLRSTIIRKFGRHQAKAKIERMPSVVRKKNDKRQLLHIVSFQVQMFQKDSLMPNLTHTESINKSDDNLKLFRPYQEYVDKLVAQAIIKSIESRYQFFIVSIYNFVENIARFQLRLSKVAANKCNE